MSSRGFNTVRDWLLAPFVLMHWVVSCLWELRFGAKWILMAIRTVMFGCVIVGACVKHRFQFWRLAQGDAPRSFNEVSFSTRCDGALADVMIPVDAVRRKTTDDNDGPAPTRRKFPVLILLTGGAWLIGKRVWMRPLAMHFADAGFITFVPDYRQFPAGTFADMVDDALDAITWVFEEIGKPGSPLEFGDVDEVILLGQSAGAHIGSLALLALARLRREQLGLVAHGISASNRPYLRSATKGVPVAFVGVSGIFDLVAVAPELHERGLHCHIMQGMCGGRPLAAFCAATNARIAAQDTRTRLAADEDAAAARAIESDGEGDGSGKVDCSASSSAEGGDRVTPVLRRRPSATAHSGARSPAKSPQHSGSRSRATTTGTSSSAVAGTDRTDATEPVTHFLPRTNLFLHGDLDLSAPVRQARDMSAIFNDAAARHTEELVGDDVFWHKAVDCSGYGDRADAARREPFYVVLPKMRTSSPVGRQERLSKNNNGSSSTAFNDSDATSDCDCFEGNRAFFMSHYHGTHTSLIVEDLFRAGTNPPLVVAVVALHHALQEQAARQRGIGDDRDDTIAGVADRCVHGGPTDSASGSEKTVPRRVAPPAASLIEAFAQHYDDVVQSPLRNPERATLWNWQLALASFITPF